MNIPVYKEQDIINAIRKEGLISDCWGYKTAYCIWVFTEGMEKEEIWEKYPTPLTGFEQAHWNPHCIETATYFLLEGYSGNLNRLPHEIEYPHDKVLIPDD